jgi:spore maturation protein CgeB
VAELVRSVTPDRATRIGQAALARVLAGHTYDRRAEQADALFQALAHRREAAE